ncbi:cytochrome P450 monooxygenase [Apiospora marii]|uniref:cytochrome P450 monooxygenase n=1 Tax=Apiospora marii TaxID=335849 RepID=UPI00312EEC53
MDQIRQGVLGTPGGLTTLVLLFGVPALLLGGLYWLALPKPIPGIPYQGRSAGRLLGDVPDMLKHIEASEGSFITFLLATVKELDTPIAQMFYSPFRAPLVILADYQETNALLRRKEFDRSSKAVELLKYLGPDHHIRQKTNARHKAQRRLIQDSMSATFLNGVAGPTIHRGAVKLVELWRAKCDIAEGRPWSATEDLDHAVLDAVNGFAYGPNFPHSALRPALGAVQGLDAAAIQTIRRRAAAAPDQVVEFPRGQMEEVIRASMDVTQSIKHVQGSIWPALRWEYVIRQPYMRKARRIRDEFITKELREAARRMEETASQTEKSAVDLMVRRCKEAALKEGKEPDYCSKVMKDEAFGFIIAGADTTSTTLSWGVKLLADHPAAQTKLRAALQAGFAQAKAERRHPTVQEITGTTVPYLDAWIEESLRMGGPIPMIDREAVVDTQVLGHPIPKGTQVLCLREGPSFVSPGFAVDEARRTKLTSSSKTLDMTAEMAWDAHDIASFAPERWLTRVGEGGEGGEKGSKEEYNASAGPHLAFSAGARRCFGPRLAYLEMRLVLTLLVWNFELLACPEALSRYGSLMVMTSRPRHCYVRLRHVDLTA